ncbi:amidohydrolase [Betaproteobacteria bacterium]|nr:amidohydrolase [Betaproteobacteria bacterium]GHU00556.1 amidohydrolase [Betaproteobacteria bacterium]GHU20552.1 amidohydrolase [Betaproteobacteria bacterium]
MNAPFAPEIAILHDELRGWRHHLHAYPETAFEEVETSRFIVERLKSFGITEIHAGIAKTGVVAVIPGQQPGPWVGLRADIDALDISEDNDVPHRSCIPGKMHACGHDGHITMLLGAAKQLAARRDFAGTVALIFQPAEENEGGGRVMVEEGLFERFPIASVFGLHNRLDLPEGHFAIKAGPLMAAYDIFEITLDGLGVHAGQPHLGHDVVVAAGKLIGALQTIVSRNVNPLHPAVLSITQVHAGHTWNVIPQQAVLRGTVRSFDSEAQDIIQRRIEKVSADVASAFDLEAQVRYERRYPPMVNAEAPTRIAIAAATALVGAERVNLNPAQTMGAEDFAFMAKQRPGAYILLGAGKGKGAPHNARYDFNDNILTTGVAYWVELVYQVLGRTD